MLLLLIVERDSLPMNIDEGRGQLLFRFLAAGGIELYAVVAAAGIDIISPAFGFISAEVQFIITHTPTTM